MIELYHLLYIVFMLLKWHVCFRAKLEEKRKKEEERKQKEEEKKQKEEEKRKEEEEKVRLNVVILSVIFNLSVSKKKSSYCGC